MGPKQRTFLGGGSMDGVMVLGTGHIELELGGVSTVTQHTPAAAAIRVSSLDGLSRQVLLVQGLPNIRRLMMIGLNLDQGTRSL